jgi:hypothetical protein
MSIKGKIIVYRLLGEEIRYGMPVVSCWLRKQSAWQKDAKDAKKRGVPATGALPHLVYTLANNGLAGARPYNV